MKSSSRTIRNAINRCMFDPCNIACAEILFHSQARNRSTVSLRKIAACESLAASWKQCLDYVTKHAQTQNFPSFCHYPRHQTCHQPCLKCFFIPLPSQTPPHQAFFVDLLINGRPFGQWPTLWGRSLPVLSLP